MPCVYHMKAADFRGATIYPLNRLRERYPEVYDAQRAKYAGREVLMEARISLLDVLWNDVIHCAPLHPHQFYRAMRDAGGAPRPDLEWFRVPLERLAHRRAVYWHPLRRPPDRPRYHFATDEFAPFVPEEYAELALLPPEQLAYYREEFAAGRRPLLARFTTHVLVAGAIDVTGLMVFRWDAPHHSPDTPLN